MQAIQAYISQLLEDCIGVVVGGATIHRIHRLDKSCIHGVKQTNKQIFNL